jgi:hypothetical protein
VGEHIALVGTATLDLGLVGLETNGGIPMRNMLTIIALILPMGAALAQVPAANPKPNTPAVATPEKTNPTAPAAGANSFTENQAKSRIENAGYSSVSSLAKDKDGVWRGKAAKAGATKDVSVDYQGNVTAK